MNWVELYDTHNLRIPHLKRYLVLSRRKRVPYGAGGVSALKTRVIECLTLKTRIDIRPMRDGITKMVGIRKPEKEDILRTFRSREHREWVKR